MSISLTPSASDWSMPQGPCRLGPMRSCIQATTLRSHTMENSTVTIRKAKQKTALMTTSHQGSVPNIERSSAARYGLMRSTSLGASAASVAGPMRTSAPGGAPVSEATPPPVEFSGSQTTRSGISVTCSGSSTRAGRAGHGEQVAVLDARLGGRGGRQPGARAACRVPASASSPSWSRPWSSSSRCPASTASPGGRARQLGRRSPAGSVAARPVPGAEPVELARARCAGPAGPGARPWRRPACAAPGRRAARGGGSSGRA